MEHSRFKHLGDGWNTWWVDYAEVILLRFDIMAPRLMRLDHIR